MTGLCHGPSHRAAGATAAPWAEGPAQPGGRRSSAQPGELRDQGPGFRFFPTLSLLLSRTQLNKTQHRVEKHEQKVKGWTAKLFKILSSNSYILIKNLKFFLENWCLWLLNTNVIQFTYVYLENISPSVSSLKQPYLNNQRPKTPSFPARSWVFTLNTSAPEPLSRLLQPHSNCLSSKSGLASDLRTKGQTFHLAPFKDTVTT